MEMKQQQTKVRELVDSESLLFTPPAPLPIPPPLSPLTASLSLPPLPLIIPPLPAQEP